MRVFLVAALLLSTSPVFAKSWSNESCSEGLVSAPGMIFTHLMDNGGERRCKVVSWPVSTATAKLECDNGTSATLSIVDEHTVRFDGKLLGEVTEDGPLCD